MELPELSELTLNDLRRLQSKLEVEIRRRSESARRDLLKKMQKMAAEEGLSLTDVIPGAPAADKPAAAPTARKTRKPRAGTKAKTTVKVAPKYRNPEDGTMTWTGRGRKPLWVESWLASGKSLDEITIAG